MHWYDETCNNSDFDDEFEDNFDDQDDSWIDDDDDEDEYYDDGEYYEDDAAVGFGDSSYQFDGKLFGSIHLQLPHPDSLPGDEASDPDHDQFA